MSATARPVGFFERQQDARRRTGRLLAAFVLAVLVVVLLLDVAVLGALHVPLTDMPRVFRAHPGVMGALSAAIALAMAVASWRKSREFAAGGGAVARSLGGVLVRPESADEAQRRLLNVVAEMSLAARIPAPAVYVLPRESGLNAFAAGHGPEDAAIGITDGALRAFNREELQAVIGHEFSHVLNGDMALNLRLVAWLHALYGVTEVGRGLIRDEDTGRRRNFRLQLLGIVVIVIGAVGYTTGRLLQAAVSRRREELADASAVQFTRNPAALTNALLKIVGVAGGSRVDAAGSLEVAHMFFASCLHGRWIDRGGTLFATHPPVIERLRALEPGFDPRSLGRRARAAAERVAAARVVTAAAPDLAAAQAPGSPAVGAAMTAAAPTTASLASARTEVAAARAPTSLPAAQTRPAVRPSAPAPRAAAASGTRAPPPPYPPPIDTPPASPHAARALRELQAHARDPAHATASVLAAVTTAYAPRRRKQLAAIERAFGADIARVVEGLLVALDATPPRARLLALVPAIEATASLSAPERIRLPRAVALLATHEPAPSVLQVAVAELVARRCTTGVEIAADAPLQSALPRLVPLIAVLARLGHGTAEARQEAYAAAIAPFAAAGVPPRCDPPADWRAALHAACDALPALHAGARRAFLNALARAALADGRLGVAEFELLRTVSLVARIPMPDLGAATSLRDAPAVAVAAAVAAR